MKPRVRSQKCIHCPQRLLVNGLTWGIPTDVEMEERILVLAGGWRMNRRGLVDVRTGCRMGEQAGYRRKNGQIGLQADRWMGRWLLAYGWMDGRIVERVARTNWRAWMAGGRVGRVIGGQANRSGSDRWVDGSWGMIIRNIGECVRASLYTKTRGLCPKRLCPGIMSGEISPEDFVRMQNSTRANYLDTATSSRPRSIRD